MATELRVLVTKGRGDDLALLTYLSKHLECKIDITLHSTNTRHTLESYLNLTSVIIGSKTINKLQFIKLMANNSGDYTHVKPYITDEALVGTFMEVGGVKANQREMYNIASTILNAVKAFLKCIEKLSENQLKTYNEKYIDFLKRQEGVVM
ncbi:hypothetical protein GF389_01575 [Candidatus Dojkabacteria bacterium]|nr:hypothetical protein [Candidatus Dojkabacteria bacterium]